MSQSVINDSTLTAIADAINAKAGTTGKMLPSAMAAKISAIPSGGGEWVKQPWFTGDESKWFHAWIRFESSEETTIELNFAVSSSSGATIDWGDGTSTAVAAGDNKAFSGTHKYNGVGDFVITVRGYTKLGRNGNDNIFSKYNAGAVRNMPSVMAVRQVQTGSLFDGTTVNIPAYQVLGYLRNIRHLKVDDGITAIGNYFAGANVSLRSLELSNTLVTIGVSAFNGSCVLISELILPDSVTSIGQTAFGNLQSVKRLVLPSGITNYTNTANYSFDSCTEIEELVIPSSLTAISSSNVFRYWYPRVGLTIKCYCATPPTLASVLFGPASSIKKILVPSGTKSLYESATNWSTYKGKFEEMEA